MIGHGSTNVHESYAAIRYCMVNLKRAVDHVEHVPTGDIMSTVDFRVPLSVSQSCTTMSNFVVDRFTF